MQLETFLLTVSWLAVDSCASVHFVPTTQGVNKLDVTDTTPVFCADNHEVRTTGSGTIPTSLDGTPQCVAFLPKVHLAPTFPTGLFSVPQACDNGQAVLFHSECGVTILRADLVDWTAVRKLFSSAIVCTGQRTCQGFAVDVPLPPDRATPSKWLSWRSCNGISNPVEP